jgi:hypothetical protein
MENPTMAEMIPRFLRLSALVATELGIEARDEEMGERDWVDTEDERERGADKLPANILSSPGSVRTSSSGNLQAKTKSYAYALRPTKEWYMLLAGLLTRAVLEGYATCAWKGTEAVECLLMVGQGTVGGEEEPKGLGNSSETKGQLPREGYEVGDDPFAQFDPDEMPSVQEAARVLFPALRNARGVSPLRKEGAEADFEVEMEDRLRKVSQPFRTPMVSV